MSATQEQLQRQARACLSKTKTLFSVGPTAAFNDGWLIEDGQAILRAKPGKVISRELMEAMIGELENLGLMLERGQPIHGAVKPGRFTYRESASTFDKPNVAEFTIRMDASTYHAQLAPALESWRNSEYGVGSVGTT